MTSKDQEAAVLKIVATDPKELAAVLCEALDREKELLGRFGRRGLIELLLCGRAEARRITCPQCDGRRKLMVTVESSGGTFYDEEQPCYECGADGKIQRVVLRETLTCPR